MLAVPRHDTALASWTQPAWLVVATEPRAEKAVSVEIHEAGFGVYLPLERRRGKPGRPNVSGPIFPGYVFAQADVDRDDWGALRHLDGVIDVLMNCSRPSRLSSGVVHALMKAEGYGLFDRTTVSPSQFEIGETVRLGTGPFAGFNAVIQEFVAKLKSTTASKRAKVLFDFMGRMTVMELPVVELEKI